MKPNTIRHGAFALISLLCFSTSIFAENARLPYQPLYKMQRIKARWSHSQPDFQVTIRMTSTLPNVKTSDLKVFIESKKGNLPVKIEADGAFSVPIEDGLLEENPSIVVNQAKGTMALKWSVGFATMPNLKNPMKYRRLLDSLSEAEDLQDEMLRAFPGSPRLTFAGLKLTFPEAKGSVIVIHANAGDRTLKPDDKHELMVLREAPLMEENPEVSLPVLPVKIEFVQFAGPKPTAQ
jgi:hypothetical protein